MAHALAQRMLSVVVALAHIPWLSHCVGNSRNFDNMVLVAVHARLFYQREALS